jgi:hypothetical protein
MFPYFYYKHVTLALIISAITLLFLIFNPSLLNNDELYHLEKILLNFEIENTNSLIEDHTVSAIHDKYNE